MVGAGETTTESQRRHVGRVYDRVARIYDLYDAPMDALGGAKARSRLLGQARGRVLEVGVGTGRNLGHYSPDVCVTGIDISARMLAGAARRAAGLAQSGSSRHVELVPADVERLPFADASFDTVTGTCVFCSVGDPVAGLREVRRVLRPGGSVLLYEHVRPDNPLLGRLFDLLSPLTRRLVGPELNRRTVDNVTAAGLAVRQVRRQGVFREIVAGWPD